LRFGELFALANYSREAASEYGLRKHRPENDLRLRRRASKQTIFPFFEKIAANLER
jgi:hypothetical protein